MGQMQIQNDTEPLVYPHLNPEPKHGAPQGGECCVVKLTIVLLGVQATLLGHFSSRSLGARVEAFPSG